MIESVLEHVKYLELRQQRKFDTLFLRLQYSLWIYISYLSVTLDNRIAFFWSSKVFFIAMSGVTGAAFRETANINKRYLV